MTQPHAPFAQWNDAGAAIVPQLTRVYLVDRGGYYELSDQGPAGASFTLQSGGWWEVDPASTARLAQSANHTISTY